MCGKKGKYTTTNTFGGAGGFEGLERGLRKGKTQKLFSSFDDAEQEAKQVPKVWGRK